MTTRTAPASDGGSGSEARHGRVESGGGPVRSEVRLHLESFADFDLERAVAVATVFDDHPHLRPVKVGGDPARTKVGDSLADRVRENGLPVNWLTVRVNKKYPRFEGGEINLREGRGGFGGNQVDGEWEYTLHPHTVKASFLAETVPDDEHLEEVAALFTELAVALDAAYGYVASGWELWRHQQWSTPRPSSAFLLRELPNVFWLNCFGPASTTRWPGLKDIEDGRTDLPNGGVVIRTTPDPWPDAPDGEGPFDAPWKQPVLAATGTEPYVAGTDERFRDLGVAVPTVEDHLAASPGTDEMPWVKVLAAKDEEKRARRHEKAHEKRVALAAARTPQPVLADGAKEWSTSFDLDDWERFHKKLKARLKGDTTGPLGTALAADIRNAPHDEEDALDLDTALGVVRLGWFIDDVEVVDLSLHGSEELVALCDRLAGFDEA